MQSLPFAIFGEEGHRLSARLDLPDYPPVAHVVFAHCFTCTKKSIAAVRVARALTTLGFGVLRFDFTGLGESGGSFSDSGFSGSVRDLVAAVKSLQMAGRAPSLMIGHSLGGAAVLAAAADLPEISAVATIGAPADVEHVKHLLSGGVAEVLAEGEAEVSIGGRPFTIRRSFIEDLARQDQKTRISKLRRPLLILHSPQDDVVSIDHASRIFALARHPKSFISLDGADHLLTKEPDAAYVAATISAWASRYLPSRELPAARRVTDYVSVQETGVGKFQLAVTAGAARFLADEPVDLGGTGTGASPYDLVAAGLGACTAMTLRLYAESKDINLGRVTVRVGHRRNSDGEDVFGRQIRLPGDLTSSERTRLMEIANRCPVHRTLENGSVIETSMDIDNRSEPAEPLT